MLWYACSKDSAMFVWNWYGSWISSIMFTKALDAHLVPGQMSNPGYATGSPCRFHVPTAISRSPINFHSSNYIVPSPPTKHRPPAPLVPEGVYCTNLRAIKPLLELRGHGRAWHGPVSRWARSVPRNQSRDTNWNIKRLVQGRLEVLWGPGQNVVLGPWWRHKSWCPMSWAVADPGFLETGDHIMI